MPEGRDFTNTTGRSEAPPRKLLTLSRATSRKTPEGTSRPYEREIGKRSLANGQEPNLDPKGSFINENDLEHQKMMKQKIANIDTLSVWFSNFTFNSVA